MAQDIGEFDLIARFLKPLATEPGAFNLEDDAAIIPVPEGKQLVMSKDVLVGNVHFFPNDLPDLIARKALRTNVSDIISKGAEPAYYALGLCFPEKADIAFIEAFAHGLAVDQNLYGMSLLGGDTTRSINDFMISVTIYGFSDGQEPVTRMGAKPSDVIYVSGTLGASALGLLSFKEPERFNGANEALLTDLQDAYLLPQPPYGLQSIVADYASASMDISDGLLVDCGHLSRASGVSAKIQQEHLPFSDGVRAMLETNPKLLDLAVQGGDDYQCLMTIPRAREVDFIHACEGADIKVTRVGVVEEVDDKPVRLFDFDKISSIGIAGYSHF